MRRLKQRLPGVCVVFTGLVLVWLFTLHGLYGGWGGPPPAMAKEAKGLQEVVDELRELRADLKDLGAEVSGALRNRPPAPERIVNLLGQVEVPEMTTATVFTVPEDRWLILTEVFFEPQLTRVCTTQPCSDPDLVQVLGDEVTFRSAHPSRFGIPEPYTSSTGWAFAPGSRVAFHSNATAPSTVFYRFLGYLAD